MIRYCPNKRLKSYKDLESVVGEASAHALWVAYDGVVPESFYKKNVSDFLTVTLDEDIEKVSNFIVNKLSIARKPFYQSFKHKKVLKLVDSNNFVKERLESMIKNVLGIDEFQLSIPQIKNNEDLKNWLTNFINSFDFKTHIENSLSTVKNELDKKYIPYNIKRNIVESFLRSGSIDNLSKYSKEQQEIIKISVPILFKENKFKSEKQAFAFASKQYRNKQESNKIDSDTLYRIMMQKKYDKYKTLKDFIDIVPNYKEKLLEKFNSEIDRWYIFASNDNEASKIRKFRDTFDKAVFINQQEVLKTLDKTNRGYDYFSNKATNSLDFIESIKNNDIYKDLINKIHNHVKKHNVRIELVDTAEVAGRYHVEFGQYDSKKQSYVKADVIYINKESVAFNTNPEQLILHEIIHSLSTIYINSHQSTKEALYKYIEYINRNIQELSSYSNMTLGFLNVYGLSNVDELVSEFYTNPEFIQLLKNIPPTKKERAFNNLFQEILATFLNWIGISKNTNAYEQLQPILDQILELQSNFDLYYDKLKDTILERNYPLSNEISNINLDKFRQEYQAAKTFFNNLKLKKPLLKNVKNQYIKSALTSDNHYIPQIDSDTKRYIVDKYFRIKSYDTSQAAKPFYPFSWGNPTENIKWKDIINADLNSRAVKYNDKKDILEFAEEVEMGFSTYEQFLARLDDAGINLSDITDKGEDAGDFLTVSTDKKLQGWQERIDRYKKQQDVLKRRLTDKSSNYASIKTRIDKLDEQIKVLEIDQRNTLLPKLARQDAKEIDINLDLIEDNLYKDLNEDQLNEVMQSLREQSMYIKGWIDVNEFTNNLSDTDLEFKKTINKLSGQFKYLNDRYNELSQKAFIQYANKTSFSRDFTQDRLMQIQSDENTISRMTLGGHMSDNEIIQIMDDITDKAQYNIHNENINRHKQLKGWIDKLKKHLNIKDENEISKRFHQLDKDGKWTGGLINKIDQSYFDQVKKLREQANTSGNWKPYFDFLDKNTFTLTQNDLEEYKRSGELPNKKYSNGESVFSKEDLDRQVELYDRYLMLRDSQVESMLLNEDYGTIVKDGDTFKSDDQDNLDRFKRTLKLWEEVNSPFSDKNKVNYFNKFLLMPKPDSQWHDKRFKVIENDKVLMDFYRYYKSTLAEDDKYLPYYDRKQSNYFAASSKGAMQDLMENFSVVKGIKAIANNVLDAFTTTVGDEYSGVSVGGTLYKNIPTGILHVDLPVENKNPNIFTGLAQHMDLATGYKYKSEVESVLNIGKELTGLVVEETEGARGGLTNTIKRAEYMLDAFLYGQRKANEDKKAKANGKDKGKEKVFSYSKTVDALNKLTYLRQMSFPNFVSPILNLGVGTVSNYNWSASVKGMDKDLTVAYKKVLGTVHKSLESTRGSTDTKKILAWLSRMNIIPELNEANYENALDIDKKLTILQSKTEYINQGALAIAQLLNHKLIDKNGKEISVFDAYKEVDGQLVWDESKMDKESIVDNTKIISDDKKGVNLYRLHRQLKGVNGMVHGDYSKALEMKKTAVGRAFALYKTWIPQTIVSRFGSERFDPQLLRTFKGRYRSLAKSKTLEGMELNFKQIVPILLKGMVTKKAFNELSQVDKENMLRNVREFKVMFTLLAAGFMLKALLDDEDEDIVKNQLFLTLNLVSRLEGDLQFYFNPANMWQILNNPVPAIGTLSDILSIGGAMVKSVSGNPYYESGPWKDSSRVGVAIGKALPVANGAIKMFNYTTKEYDFSSMY